MIPAYFGVAGLSAVGILALDGYFAYQYIRYLFDRVIETNETVTDMKAVDMFVTVARWGLGSCFFATLIWITFIAQQVIAAMNHENGVSAYAGLYIVFDVCSFLAGLCLVALKVLLVSRFRKLKIPATRKALR
ncbi:hypothetical protein BCR33DRAFT_781245 [Rhizoclosmatium globosum]|uniref:Uncharacterized protein n=1 Tax=Rhizoclosmatium globosum TaxID=329046 RepID=A0A1Y2CU23_9FUNG|nr:hypothetical protein BCR33DRAFT_781245 [Rhizoclosmatium globosum]|eukprot:ORY50539.1 hypothetical protein BCR33DRAFT_781245 [Rhizoclosmatium globosum]